MIVAANGSPTTELTIVFSQEITFGYIHQFSRGKLDKSKKKRS
jgi:hypothetical protein